MFGPGCCRGCFWVGVLSTGMGKGGKDAAEFLKWLAGVVTYRQLETIMLSPQNEICLKKVDPFMK